MLIYPEWAAPACVHAAMTTRLGGVSEGAFASLNLGYSTEDVRSHVMENERRAARALGVTTDAIRWVHQVHGSDVHAVESLARNDPLGATSIRADAIVSRTRGLVCGIKVADCMPVLLSGDGGRVVAAAHAGWRGLALGVLERTIDAMDVPTTGLSVWIGPCVGRLAFEVGEDVRDAFLEHDDASSEHFLRRPHSPATAPKYLCDLVGLARQRLERKGVRQIAIDGRCTFSDPHRFFSHRREARSGRMAAFIWID